MRTRAGVKYSEAAELALQDLKGATDKPSASIVRKVAATELRLRADCQAGKVIKKSQIPTALKNKYDSLENLYKVKLSDFWRLLYTIIRDGSEVSVTILEIVDHDSYNKWFPSDHD